MLAVGCCCGEKQGVDGRAVHWRGLEMGLGGLRAGADRCAEVGGKFTGEDRRGRRGNEIFGDNGLHERFAEACEHVSSQ